MDPSLFEPSYIREFKENSSRYLLEDKVDSEEMSADVEFHEADKMTVYEEDDFEVRKIETAKRLAN